jgi:hypothetical protein
MPAFVTIHPSFLLRMRDSAGKERAFHDFVTDLRRAKEEALSRHRVKKIKERSLSTHNA